MGRTRSAMIALMFLMSIYNLVLSSPCSSLSCSDVEKHAKQQLRTALLRAMHMSGKQTHNVNQSEVEEARRMQSMMHTPHHEELEQLYILARTPPTLGSSEFIFPFPDSLLARTTTSAALFFALEPMPDFERVIVDVFAREISEETFNLVSSSPVTLHASKATVVKTNLGEDNLRGWMYSESQSVVLSIIIRDLETGLVVDDSENRVQNVKLEISMVARAGRRRRAIKEGAECKSATDPNQECCVQTRNIAAADLGFHNIVSPTTLRLSYCAGQCKLASSFP
ncbi:hypothetical protein PENTCL1PPCAC_29444, partial [Pristionchus entomophagus]